MKTYSEIVKDINDLEGDYWIRANAGCGKTTKLVARFIFLLENNIKPEDILCITYTNAAANEMKKRIKEKLEQPQINKLFKQKGIYVDINTLQISTIHSFCQNFLQMNGILPKKVNILNSDERLMDKITNKVIDKIASNNKLTKAIQNIAKSNSITEFQNFIKDIISKQNNFRQLNENIFDTKINNDIDIQNFIKLLPLELQQFKDLNIDNIKQEIINKIKLFPERYMREIFNNNINIKDIYNIDNEHWYDLVMTKKHEPRKTIKIAKELKNICLDIQTYFIQKNNKLCFDVNLSALIIAKETLKIYEEIKHQMNSITYDDMLYETNKISKKIGLPKIKYIMLDEAQDTNPISFDIISKFTDHEGKPSKIFVVGDAKQSIYSFQGSNLEFYYQYYDMFKTRNLEQEHWHDDVVLDTSYRSKKEILEYVDNFCRQNQEAFCRNKQEYTIEHKTAIEGEGKVEKLSFNYEIDKAEKTNNWIEIMQNKLTEQNKIDEKANELSQKIYEICKTGNSTAIIVPKRNTKNGFVFDVIGKLQDKIKVQLSPEFAIKSIYFKDLISIFKFFNLQNDNINLVCILKSNLFNITDKELQEIFTNKKETLWNNLICKQWNNKFKMAIDFLKKILSYNSIIEIQQSINKQCENINPKCYNDSIELLNNIINQYIKEDNNIYDIRCFINYISNASYKNNEDKATGVVFNTIHGVKGLEFDNVVLLDFESKTASLKDNMFFFIDYNNNQRSFFYKTIFFQKQCFQQINNNIEIIKNHLLLEKNRLLYVAITRAKDRFYYFISHQKG